MIRPLVLCFLFHAGLWAQIALDPAKGAQAFHALEPLAGEEMMACSVDAIRPAISYSFKMQAGFVMSVPVRPYAGKSHVWAVLLRVTPDANESKPLYLGSNFRVPKMPASRDSLAFSGVFLVGEGDFTVDFVSVDDTSKVCRKTWHVKAKLNKDEQRMKGLLPPNTAQALYFAPKRAADSTPAKNRVTILLHAAPAFPRSTQLRGRDRARLLGSLASLLEQLPDTAVRLVAFNLDQQREIYRTNTFNGDSFEKLAEALQQLDLGVVDIRTLNNRKGHIDMLSDLIDSETSSAPDAVIFLGPTARNTGKVPAEKSSDAPRFFYFQFKLMRERPGPPDAIESATKALGGKVISIHTPTEYARAIDQLEKYLARGR